MLKELKNLPFSFRFGETTTSQIKEQYGTRATYKLRYFGQAVTAYLETLFVRRSIVDDLLCHLFELLEKIDLSPDCILLLDGPNASLSFKGKLENDLSKKNKKLIDVGSCRLYTCCNSFLEGLKVLTLESDIDFDKFSIDLFGFFKLSIKQIKDYSEVEIFTDLQGRRMMKHVSTHMSTS